jgi:hypothetical protein
MARNGSGSFSITDGILSGPGVCAQQKTAGVKVTASRMDNILDDIATGLSNSLAANGEKLPTANLPMGNFKHTGVALATAATDYARTDQAQGNSLRHGTTGGTSTAYTLTLTPAITAYTTGFTVSVVWHTLSGVNPTLNVNAVGAANIVDATGTNVPANVLRTGIVYTLVYNGTAFVVVSPAETPFINYAPSWTSNSGLMSYTTTPDLAQWSFNFCNRRVHLQIRATGTTAGTAAQTIRLTTPINFANVSEARASSTSDGASFFTASVAVLASATAIDIYKADNTNYGLGAGRIVALNAVYVAA